jgi:hypothetical protein
MLFYCAGARRDVRAHGQCCDAAPAVIRNRLF